MKKYLVIALAAFVAVSLLAACGAPGTPTAAPATAAPTTAAPVKPGTPAPKTEITTAPKPSSPSPAPSKPSEAPFYQGKTIEILVDSAAGGGTDTMARITAPYLTKYIPGNPNIIMRNQSGAGGSIGTQSFQQKTKPDGLHLLQHGSGVISMQLASRDVASAYDLTKNRYVANVSRAESVLMIKKGMMGRLTDMSAPPLFVGTKEGQETWQAMVLYGREFLGWNVKWLVGYGGTSEMELAFRRGEIEVVATSNAFIVQRMTTTENLAETISIVGNLKNGKYQRRPDFPNVPTFEELLGAKKPAGLPWQAYVAWTGPTAVDKALAAPPGTPDNIMAILTGAMSKAKQDPQYNDMITKLVAETYDIGVGKETDDMMKQVLAAPPEAIAYTRDLQIKFGIISK